MRRFLLILLALPVSACGLMFGPGYSMNDPQYFMQKPYLVKDASNYLMKWKYGEMGFYFTPKCKVIDAALLCSLQGTSSTGNRKGKPGEITISDPGQVNALESGGVYWFEPDGKRLKLEIINNA